MNVDKAFSSDYASARNRFRRLSRQATDSLTVFPVLDPDDDLSIDVAEFGDPQARRKLVITSGLHGVEGFVGSAIQAALIEKLIHQDLNPAGYSLVLIHAINPYGFKYLRRVNEDNIDLNRNFLLDFSQKPNSSNYARFDTLLNPQSEISGFDFFTLKAYSYICRHGLGPLRDSIASGQYQFPKGLFYGGSSFAESTRHVRDIFLSHCSGDTTLFHIDIHSGLGNYGEYRLLLSSKQATESSGRFRSAFDSQKSELIGQHDGITGSISGTICDYFSTVIGDHYHHLGLEFGTFGNLRILKMMRIENAAHHFLDHCHPRNKIAKKSLLDCFCPRDPKWRSAVLRDGVKVIDRATNHLRRG